MLEGGEKVEADKGYAGEQMYAKTTRVGLLDFATRPEINVSDGRHFKHYLKQASISVHCRSCHDTNTNRERKRIPSKATPLATRIASCSETSCVSQVASGHDTTESSRRMKVISDREEAIAMVREA